MNTLLELVEESNLAAGTVFGRYEIVRPLGAGGMGVVYEALHRELRKPVAIKIMKPEQARLETARLRFLREAEAAARIRHPHVVDVSDVGNHGGLPFLVMEYLEGEDLGALLRREGRLDVGRALDILLPVIAGVAAGHDQGVVHRDLKPQNIFLARRPSGDLTPKVLDFGVSKLLGATPASGNLTAAGAVYGTVQYMSPEQANGSQSIGPGSDQYTLATILFECITGQRSFPGENTLELLRRICSGTFAPPSTLRADLSPALEAVVLRAMSLDPAARFESLYPLGGALLPFAPLRTRLIWETTFLARAALSPAITPSTPPAGRTLVLPALSDGDEAAAPRTMTLPPERVRRGARGRTTTSRRTVGSALRRRLDLRVGVVGGVLLAGLVTAALWRRPPPGESNDAHAPPPPEETAAAPLVPPPALAPPAPSPAADTPPASPSPPEPVSVSKERPSPVARKAAARAARERKDKRRVQRGKNNAPVVF